MDRHTDSLSWGIAFPMLLPRVGYLGVWYPGVAVSGMDVGYPRDRDRGVYPTPKITKAGGTHPTGMLSCKNFHII